MNLGLSFYGRGFGDVGARAPGSSFGSIPAGTTQPGQYDYADLVRNRLPSMTVEFEVKARYSVLNDLGGVTVWELSNDAEGRLLTAARRGLGLREFGDGAER